MKIKEVVKFARPDAALVDDKNKGKKYYLWAFIDEYGNTIIQRYSENYPKAIVEQLNNR